MNEKRREGNGSLAAAGRMISGRGFNRFWASRRGVKRGAPADEY